MKADIHRIANEIFGAIVWGAQIPPPPFGAAYPSYTRYGNSDAETEARVIAARILAALEPDPAALPNGGPAYPVMWDYAENETGMSLRDWFAGQALAGAGLGSLQEHDVQFIEQYGAANAYRIADAMIAARGGK